MNINELKHNVFIAFAAQGISMVLSIIQSLVVPKILGVEQFGYWQLFLFYASYVGFFHFGLSSGIYLKMGGIPRDNFDHESTKSQFIFGVIFQSVIAVSIVLISGLLETDWERSFVISQTAIYLVLQNACTYLMNVLQCMNETKYSSFSTMAGKTAFFIPLAVLIVLKVNTFEPYVVAYVLSTIAQLGYCLYHLREFICAKWLGLLIAAKKSLSSIKIGINLMMANIASMVILGVARFLIDDVWGIETFGKLSLVFSLANFFLAFISQASMVLFPALRQANSHEAIHFYQTARDALSLLLPGVYLLYYPMVAMVGWWLPAYADSLPYLALLLPVCVFDSMTNITGNTFLQVFRRERQMLKINMLAAGVSIICSLAGAYVFRDPAIILCGASLAVAVRCLLAERSVSGFLGILSGSAVLGMLFLSMSFVALSVLMPSGTAACLYAAIYLAYLAYFRRELSCVLTKLGVFKKRA